MSLSQLLNTISFSFFNVVSLPESTPPLQYELFKINKTVEELYSFLNNVVSVLASLGEPKLDWYSESKESVLHLCQYMNEADNLMPRLLHITSTIQDHAVAQLLFSKLEDTSDLLIDAKKHVYVLRRNVDIAVLYSEINHSAIQSLDAEINTCMDMLNVICQWKSTSSQVPYDFEDIVTKLRINDVATINDSLKSTKLPTFNNHDSKYYDEYLSLCEKVEPLAISLGILPLQMEDFNKMAGTAFPRSRFELNSKYEGLMARWNSLNSELKSLRVHFLDSKWHDLFEFLIHEILKRCQNIIDNPGREKPSISPEMSSAYKLCSNTISLISKAFKESVLYDQRLVDLFNDTLLPQWQKVNDVLANPPKAKSTPKITTSTPKSMDSSSSTPPKDGLDLGIDIETTCIPFSIQKKDRTKDLGTSFKPRRLRYSLCFPDVEDEDTTLVPRTPHSDIENLNTSISNLRVEKTEISTANTRILEKTVEPKFDAQAFLNQLTNTLPQKPSRIPLVHPKYILMGLPIIRKKVSAKSRIPSISTNGKVSSPQLKSPVRLKRLSNSLGSPIRSPHNFKRVLESGDLLLQTSSTLVNSKIPKLFQPYNSYHSSSPERPFSSLGSRFDEAHLIQ